jgi:hypothetical protein
MTFTSLAELRNSARRLTSLLDSADLAALLESGLNSKYRCPKPHFDEA